MNSAGWGAIGSVLTALLLYFGSRYTARTSKKATEYTATLNAPETISTGYARLTDDLWQSIRDLRGRVTALEEDALLQRSRYRASIAYIRVLLSFITRHVPDKSPPQPPVELHEDVRILDTEEES